jgi:Flp pilus assembly pilin Flp
VARVYLTEREEVREMTRELKRFWQDESGPELVEWAVVTIILLVAAVALYRTIGEQLGKILSEIARILGEVLSPP